jgi:hypothetical protein
MCNKSESKRKRRATKISLSQVMRRRWFFDGLTGLIDSGAGLDFLVGALRFDAIFCNRTRNDQPPQLPSNRTRLTGLASSSSAGESAGTTAALDAFEPFPTSFTGLTACLGDSVSLISVNSDSASEDDDEDDEEDPALSDFCQAKRCRISNGR